MTKQFGKKNIIIYLCAGGGMALLFFLFLYGHDVVNPHEIDWIMTSGNDLPQHYLGWRGFRLSTWRFPIGMTDTLSYPRNESVIFTDAVPLMAILFKLLRDLLDPAFQYLGFWGVLSFIMHGIMAARIITHVTQDAREILIGTLFLMISPVLLQRMFYHTALASHWILFLMIEPLLFPQAFNNKQMFCRIILAAFFAGTVHAYLSAMNAVVLCGILLREMISERRWKLAVCYGLTYGCLTVFSLWILGGFDGGVPVSGSGLGAYRFNLDAFVNPVNTSALFQGKWMEYRTSESYAYLGLGVILAILVAIVIRIITFRTQSDAVYANRCYVIIVCVFALLIAASPSVSIGRWELVQYNLPEPALRLWAVFRSTGRFSWIVVYILMIWGITEILRWKDKRRMALLGLLVIIQVIDMKDYMVQIRQRFHTEASYVSRLSDPVWKKLGSDPAYQHIVIVSVAGAGEVYDFAYYAVSHQMTINRFVFARETGDETERDIPEFRDDTIYIFREEDVDDKATDALALHYADGFIVGVTDEPAE